MNKPCKPCRPYYQKVRRAKTVKSELFGTDIQVCQWLTHQEVADMAKELKIPPFEFKNRIGI